MIFDVRDSMFRSVVGLCVPVRHQPRGRFVIVANPNIKNRITNIEIKTKTIDYCPFSYQEKFSYPESFCDVDLGNLRNYQFVDKVA